MCFESPPCVLVYRLVPPRCTMPRAMASSTCAMCCSRQAFKSTERVMYVGIILLFALFGLGGLQSFSRQELCGDGAPPRERKPCQRLAFWLRQKLDERFWQTSSHLYFLHTPICSLTCSKLKTLYHFENCQGCTCDFHPFVRCKY